MQKHEVKRVVCAADLKQLVIVEVPERLEPAKEVTESVAERKGDLAASTTLALWCLFFINLGINHDLLEHCKQR